MNKNNEPNLNDLVVGDSPYKDLPDKTEINTIENRTQNLLKLFIDYINY